MKLIQTIILIILLSLGFVPIAQGADDSNFDWMNTSLLSLGSILPSCIEAPLFASIHQSSTSLNAQNGSVWVPTGVYVQQGKMLSMRWDTSGISRRPKKYRVLYRVDPRFSKPQVFIQKYDYIQQKYISDFHHYKSQILPFYQDRPEIFNSQRFDDFKDYFNFAGRETISVQKDDVINITLDGGGNFFGSDGEMQNGLGVGANPITIYTDSSGISNKILYASGKRWCADIITALDPNYSAKCNSFPDKYVDPDWSALRGQTSDPAFTSKLLAIPSCPDNVDGPDNIPACFYDKGRGFKVTIGGSSVKSATQKFVYSPFTGKYFLYHHSDASGDLNFTTPWPILGNYQDLSQTMEEWKSFATGNDADDIIAFNAYLNTMATTAPMNFLHFGVYAMEIEIGKGHTNITDSDLGNVNVQYTILDGGTPGSSSSSNSVSKNFRNDAYASGYVWLRVMGTDDMAGNINVKVANYKGSNWFSSVVYGSVIKPLRDKYNELSQLIYRKLIGNAALQNIAKSLLVVYIIIYGLVFLMGAVQITTTDIVTRVLKIGVIVALFSDTSWTFFNDNLFNVFVSGSDYLLTTVVGATSSTGNIFGFIDPIFDRYTNGNLWSLLAIQLLSIHNGLAFFSIMTIYGILIYFRAILEVIISYCLAFLGIAVMISLAPFFILMILFERTKSLFDNWLSTLFSYMVQPTILLIFFLLIDQMMSEYITGTVVKACWGILFPIKIGLDLSTIGIPISFSFPLPFLPGIPFYVPQVQGIDSAATLIGNGGTFVRIASSAFIFFVYCKLAAGLVEYVTLVVQHLTNVMAATPEGKSQQAKENPITSVMGDMKKLASPVTGAVKGVGGFAKEKLIDQKITHRGKAGGGEVDYSKITRKDASSEESTDKTNTSNVTKLSEVDSKIGGDKVKTSGSGGGAEQNRSQSTGTSGTGSGGTNSETTNRQSGFNSNIKLGSGGNDNVSQTGSSSDSTLSGSGSGSNQVEKQKPESMFKKALSTIMGDNAVNMTNPQGKIKLMGGPKVDRTSLPKPELEKKTEGGEQQTVKRDEVGKQDVKTEEKKSMSEKSTPKKPVGSVSEEKLQLQNPPEKKELPKENRKTDDTLQKEAPPEEQKKLTRGVGINKEWFDKLSPEKQEEVRKSRFRRPDIGKPKIKKGTNGEGEKKEDK